MADCNFEMAPQFWQMAVPNGHNRIRMATFFADGAKLRVACVVQNSNDVFCWLDEKTAIPIRYNLKILQKARCRIQMTLGSLTVRSHT